MSRLPRELHAQFSTVQIICLRDIPHIGRESQASNKVCSSA
jgi:hypothetical protein